MTDMQYRRLGRSGLKVSLLSFGSWVTFANADQIETGKQAAECLDAAKEVGVNFFDNAESYAAGESERVMGEAFRELGWKRHEYVVSTKLFWGLHDVPNMRNTLNRKYLSQAIDGALERFGLDFVDLVFCHRPDPKTPIEETVWAMHDIVSGGQALYWGTSNWPAESIREAVDIAERHHLRKPVVEQPQYNLLHRDRVEKFLAPVCSELGIGLTTWSPLSFGILTGKYLNGVPESNRVAAEVVRLSKEVGCTPAQLAIAWCLQNPHVSSVITGASNVAQVRENLIALEVAKELDDNVLANLEIATAKPASS